MNHRKWNPGSLYAQAMRDITNEHNATVDAWQQAEAEAARMGRENDALCDEIAALRDGWQNSHKAEDELAMLRSGIRVPFSDEKIHTMATVCSETWAAGATMPNAIRAALAAGGLEPCAVPEYAPEDVALNSRVPELESKVENQRMSLRQLHEARELDAVKRMELERELKAVKAERDELRDRSNRFDLSAQELSRIVDDQKRDKDRLQRNLDTARAELAAAIERAEQAEAERDDLQYETPIIKELRDILGLGWGESIKDRCSELAALRQPVPVKVRFSVTDAQFNAAWLNEPDKKQHWYRWAMDYLAAHTVIDAPAGVPDLETLKAIAIDAYNEGAECGYGHAIQAATVAIRDAVLAGVRPVAPTDAQVAALARVLHKLRNGDGISWEDSRFQNDWRATARAAFAHIGAVPDCPTCLDKHPFCSACGSPKFMESAPIWSGPTRAEAEAKWKALRSRHTSDWVDYRSFHDWIMSQLPESAQKGWELDVTEKEIRNWWHENVSGSFDVWPGEARALTEFFRSRIRPTFECKECAELEEALTEAHWKLDRIKDELSYSPARAALEASDAATILPRNRTADNVRTARDEG